MSIITIKDLPESIALDREAMLAISGGARFSGNRGFAGGASLRAVRFIGDPKGLARHVLASGGRAKPTVK